MAEAISSGVSLNITSHALSGQRRSSSSPIRAQIALHSDEPAGGVAVLLQVSSGRSAAHVSAPAER